LGSGAFGTDRILRLDFESNSSPITFAEQSLAGLSQRLKEFKSDMLPAFGKPTGFVINYTQRYAVAFDLNGNPAKALDAEFRPGGASMSVRGREIDLQCLLNQTGPASP
jgi:hypothetical protein